MPDSTETTRMPREDWERLFQRHFHAVKRYFAFHRVGPADADDLAQEVFKELARCKVPSEPNTYILAIARNVLSRYRRRIAREHAALDGYSQHCKTDREAVGSHVSGESPLEERSIDELTQLLKIATHRLPARYSELVDLRFREGLSVSQVARRMKCSKDVVWKRLQRLRTILQRCDRETISG
jgi:RNA polymerase sigma factor (sigma-70 family)